jgi:hypothetical protein
MEYSSVTFNKIKSDAEAFYASVGVVRCPYFGEEVHFNAKGWKHLLFKEWNTTRITSDQFARLRHIKLAPEIIRQSKTLQGIRVTKKFERIQINGHWENVIKMITYYEFIAVMDSHGSQVRVRIIVKQVEGHEKIFWSLIPFWQTDKKTGRRILSSGNPEND